MNLLRQQVSLDTRVCAERPARTSATTNSLGPIACEKLALWKREAQGTKLPPRIQPCRR